MSEQAKRLEIAASELGGALDGDVAILVQLIDRIERGEVEDNLQRLKREVGKLKKRVVWDSVASEMGPQYAIQRYGPRP